MANAALKSYSFLDSHIAFAGPTGAFPLGLGAAEGGITVAMVDVKNNMTIGAGGDVQHALHASKAATVTLSLLKNSPDNALLNVAYNLQSQSSKLWGQNIISITTSNGDAVVLTAVAFKKQPNVAYGKEAAELVWEFDCGSADFVLAGSL